MSGEAGRAGYVEWHHHSYLRAEGTKRQSSPSQAIFSSGSASSIPGSWAGMLVGPWVLYQQDHASSWYLRAASASWSSAMLLSTWRQPATLVAAGIKHSGGIRWSALQYRCEDHAGRQLDAFRSVYFHYRRAGCTTRRVSSACAQQLGRTRVGDQLDALTVSPLVEGIANLTVPRLLGATSRSVQIGHETA